MAAARRKFKSTDREYIYRLFLGDDRPSVRDGLRTAFERGRAGHDARCERTSLAYAAWAAGRKKFREDQR